MLASVSNVISGDGFFCGNSRQFRFLVCVFSSVFSIFSTFVVIFHET